MSAEWKLHGSSLSPFSVKVESALVRARVPFRVLPADGGFAENLRLQLTRQAMVRGLLEPTAPRLDGLLELPLVPFLYGAGGARWFDSTTIVRELHARRHQLVGVPLAPEDPFLDFVTALIDETFDEVGLYVLHHQRWVASAATHRAKEVLFHEYRSLLPPPVLRWSTERFASRQVRRLPYLFSVAPPGFSVPGLRADWQPPSRAGFPATHALLDAAREDLLSTVDLALSRHPFVLGGRYTLADAAAVGMLRSHRRCDVWTHADIERRFPRLARYDAEVDQRAESEVTVDDEVLRAFIEVAARWLLPLLIENERAYRRFGEPQVQEANEHAFNEDRFLFEGELQGHPYKTVVKTGQVVVLRDLRRRFEALSDDVRRTLLQHHPGLEVLC